MEFEFGVVDNIETVPEAFRVLYNPAANAEGKFEIAATHKGAADALLGLNKSLKAARLEAKGKAAPDLSSLSEFGTTVDEINTKVREKIANLESELTKGGEAKLNLDKIRQELAEGHSKDLKKHEARIQALQEQLYERMVTSDAIAALSEEKGDVELLMPFIKNQVRVSEKDGKLEVFVVDAVGDQRYSGVTGQPMTVKELVKEMKANARYGKLFESENDRGGGGVPQPGQKKPAPTGAPRSSTDKISAGLKKQTG